MVNLERIGWENGTLISKGKVTIGGQTYDVEPAQYEGKTPISAELLKQQENNIENFVKNILKIIFPVGSTYTTPDDTNPSTILGFGTWERLKGKVAVGLDEDDTDGYFDEIGKTGGEKKHQLTTDELSNHSHGNVYVESGNGNLQQEQDWFTGVSWGNRKGFLWVGATGNDQPHNNVQPYEVVGYMWIRRS